MSDEAHGVKGVIIITLMNTSAYPDVASWSGACLVINLSGMVAQGPEAAAFLHGQLSQDVQALDASSARLAAYCSAKGRMQASGLLVRPDPETVWLWLDASVQAATLKRLSMFVMRSKLKLSDLAPRMSAVGLVGSTAAQAVAPAQSVTLAEPWQSVVLSEGSPEVDATVLVRLPDVLGASRWLWLGPQTQASTVLEQAGALPPGAWDWLDVMSGVARIEARTVDQFVPQMINYELVGGINFKKGCYPGQEVVARSQYRGTAKRRLFVVHADGVMTPGQEVFSSQDPEQPCGMVVNAAVYPVDGRWAALAELKLAHLDSPLMAGSGAQAVALHLGELPYAVPMEEA
jgi:folate-binding protein YgfZ